MTAASGRDDGNKPKGRGRQAEGMMATSRREEGGKQGKHNNGEPKKLSAASGSHN
jgi:hypothetical protein